MTKSDSEAQGPGGVYRVIGNLWMMPLVAFVSRSFAALSTSFFVLSFHWSDETARGLAWLFILLAGAGFCVGANGSARWQIMREEQRDARRE